MEDSLASEFPSSTSCPLCSLLAGLGGLSGGRVELGFRWNSPTRLNRSFFHLTEAMWVLLDRGLTCFSFSFISSTAQNQP